VDFRRSVSILARQIWLKNYFRVLGGHNPFPETSPFAEIVDPTGKNCGFHRCSPRLWQCFHPSIQIEACGRGRSFVLKRPTAVLYAIADGPLVQIQSRPPPTERSFITIWPLDPFYGYNRPGAKPSQGVIWNWWRQGMMGGAKAHYGGIVAFSQTDFTEDLKKFTVPTLVMHGDDDQIVPYADSGPLSAKLVRGAILKTYKGFPHGRPTTNADQINADLLEFIAAKTSVAAV
jgi:pimeloyl-ACP methyl ester carboxylesterase